MDASRVHVVTALSMATTRTNCQGGIPSPNGCETMLAQNACVIFARSPPEFKRESRMVDAFDFEAGKHSAICAKLDCNSVKRIHDDIVVGIEKATWDKLKKKYRSGEEAL